MTLILESNSPMVISILQVKQKKNNVRMNLVMVLTY